MAGPCKAVRFAARRQNMGCVQTLAPTLTTPDQIHNGILLPRLSVDQFGTRLGRWFGLSPSQLLDVFPTWPSRAWQPSEGLFKA